MISVSHLWILDCPVAQSRPTVQIQFFPQIYATIMNAASHVLASPLPPPSGAVNGETGDKKN